MFEGKAAHIIDNRHRVYHSDPEHLAKAKSEFPEKARENGVTEPKPEPEEEKGKGKGRGRGSKGTGSAQNTRTESSPAPEPTPTVVTRQKEPPRESKKSIYFASKLSDRVVAEGSKIKLTCYLDGTGKCLLHRTITNCSIEWNVINSECRKLAYERLLNLMDFSKLKFQIHL